MYRVSLSGTGKNAFAYTVSLAINLCLRILHEAHNSAWKWSTHILMTVSPESLLCFQQLPVQRSHTWQETHQSAWVTLPTTGHESAAHGCKSWSLRSIAYVRRVPEMDLMAIFSFLKQRVHSLCLRGGRTVSLFCSQFPAV